MKELPSRKTTRLAIRNYRDHQSYFLTLCCYRRQTLLADEQAANWILTTLQAEAAAQGFSVLAYCAMPDHLHFLASGTRPNCDLLRFLKSFKIKTSRSFARRKGVTLWQHAYYEHVLRDSAAVE